MPSSISSSDKPSATEKYGRPLPQTSLRGAAWLGLLVMLVLMSGWELYWRSQGSIPGYRNSPGLWVDARRRVEPDSTVLAGSSRVLFNVQPAVWEEESGERPIQLALPGTSPVTLMEQLADDESFRGTLLVGVAPGLFFSGFEMMGSSFERVHKESPSQWLGQRLSMLVEPLLAFYQPDYALFTILTRQPLRNRDGVDFEMEVRRLSIHGRDRTTRMWSKLETDPEYAELAKTIWADGFKPIDERDEEWRTEALESREEQIERAVTAANRLQARGVEVIFVRNAAEGHYAISEPMYNPRAETWDILIERSGALGIHWLDHEELQGFWLPEWSHMSASEADRFTKALYHVIERERVKRNSGD